MLHAHANKLITADSVEPHTIKHFDVDAFVDNLDPAIWKAACLITQPSNKSVFTLCQILFTINRQCCLEYGNESNGSSYSLGIGTS